MKEPILPRTFPREHLESWSDEDWLKIPMSWVPIDFLVPSQEGVSLFEIAKFVNGGKPNGGDIAGRAVLYDGILNLYDGTHRWLIEYLKGALYFPVRIVDGVGKPVERGDDGVYRVSENLWSLQSLHRRAKS